MGIVNAAQKIGMKKPIIIRLKGTNVEEAKKLIEVSCSLCFMFFFLYLFFSFVVCLGFRIPIDCN
jgi:hypothetical protein